MPKKDFTIRTEYDTSSKALIIDEIGEFPSVLVDSLLNHGCSVYYFGVESRETFYYLADKKNFIFLDDLQEVNQINPFNYCFYFPRDKLSRIEEIIYLSERDGLKILVCHNLEFADFSKENVLIKERNLNLRIVIYDELFGPRIQRGLLGNLFSEAVKKGKVAVEKLPEEEILPVSASRLSEELLKTIFSLEPAKKLYFVDTGEVKISYFAGLVKKFIPGLTFSFAENETTKKHVIQTEVMKKIVVHEEIEEEIEKTCDWFVRKKFLTQNSGLKKEIQNQKGENLKDDQAKDNDTPDTQEGVNFLFPPAEVNESLPETKKKSSGKKFQFLLGGGLFIFLVLAFFVIPFAATFCAGIWGFKLAILSRKDSREGKVLLAIEKAKKADKYFTYSQKALSVTGPFYSLIGFGNSIEKIDAILEVSSKLNRSSKFSLQAIWGVSELAVPFINGQEVKWIEETGAIKANISLAYQEASLAQSLLAEAEPGFRFLKQETLYQEMKSLLPQVKEGLLKAKGLIDVLPTVLGVGGRKTYLLLLQNNLELRPTGGFIGSYGIVNLENGKLVNFDIHDVYQADSLLKGKVEPPAKLREYLGESVWYLRDSNWEPDFPTSAKKAEWFLDKETQLSTDGVIAVNLSAFQDFLSIFGEIVLPSQQSTIDQNNLFLKAQSSLERTTAGSQGEIQDFLGNLAKESYEKLKKGQLDDYANLGRSLFGLLERKEILLYSNDLQTESVVTSLGWDGSIKNYHPSVEGYSIYSDYLSIYETNVGINKVNVLVNREIEQKIEVGIDGHVTEKLKLSYENQSPSGDFPVGAYKNYLRIFLPRGSRVNMVLTSDSIDNGLWVPLSTEAIDISDDYGKTVLGLLLEIPAKSKKQIELSYELPGNVDLTGKTSSYVLFIQRQSGDCSSKYNLIFTYPNGYVPLRVIPQAKIGNGQLVVSGTINRDKILQIDLAH